MDKAEARIWRLNHAVVLTVVLLAACIGIAKVKEDNLAQAMQRAKASETSFLAEYQASKIKQHMAESALAQAKLLGLANPAAASAATTQEIQLRLDIAQYQSNADKEQRQAKAKEAQYGELNFHTHQFDLGAAALLLAIACAALALAVQSWLPLVFGWLAGVVGVLFTMAGFAGWQVHPDWLIRWLS